MKRIGLTGNIGSGKSTVAHLFSILQVPVFNSDEQAKKLMNENDDLKNSLSNIFGQELYQSGVLNKEYLSTIIFNDSSFKKKIEDLIHPLVNLEFDCWCVQHSNHQYVIKEAAILFERGLNNGLDAIICVSANMENRIHRVMERSALSRQDVLDIMRNQWDEKKKAKYSDYLISNEEGDMLIPQVLELHETLKQVV